MAINIGDQAMIDNRRIEVVKPYKVKHYWVVRTVSGPESDQTIMSSGTIKTFQVKPVEMR